MKATTAILACSVMLGWGLPSEARQKRPSVRGQINKAVNLIQKENKQLAQQLKTAQEQYPQVQLEYNQSEETYKQAKKELQEQEKALQGRVGEKVGLTEAIAALEKADEEYEAASNKLAEELADDEKFQKLLTASEDAEAKLEQLRADNPKANDSQSEAIRHAAKAVLAAKEAVKDRLNGDPKVKPLLDAKHEADGVVKEARKKYDKAAKTDPEMRRAEKRQRESREAYRKAQQSASQLEARIASIQQQIATNLMLIGQ